MIYTFRPTTSYDFPNGVLRWNWDAKIGIVVFDLNAVK